jgi:hypothetical protein
MIRGVERSQLLEHDQDRQHFIFRMGMLANGGPKMRRVVSLFGWIALALAVVLNLLGISNWPPGGLMFALPFVFLVPGFFLALLGAFLLWLGRRRGPPAGPMTIGGLK